jgi:hypothetical protein
VVLCSEVLRIKLKALLLKLKRSDAEPTPLDGKKFEVLNPDVLRIESKTSLEGNYFMGM